MKIGIACGGTGGHIFPGLAVAEELRRRGHAVVLWLAGKPGEDLALAGWNGPIVTVYARGVSSHAPRAMIATCFRLARAVLQCRRSLKRFSPDVLLAMGSYASVGPVLAARWLNIPVVLHEANVIPGRAIRFLGRWAEAVAVGFEETRSHLAHRRLVVTGMPVREGGERRAEGGERRAEGGERRTESGERRTESGERKAESGERRAESGERKAESGEWRAESGERLADDGRRMKPTPNIECKTEECKRPQSEIGNQQSEIKNQKSEISWGALAPTVFTLLVMGGSRGAHRLNEVASQAIVRLHCEGNSLQAIHLAGPADEGAIRQVYRQAGVPHAVFGFLHEMPRAYRQSSLAICRSGASTCAELSCYGTPALLVPYPFAIHQHQAANADALAASGSADICDEQILTVDWLVGYVAGLMRDPARLAHMRAAALRRVTNDPASALADLVEEVGNRTTDGRRRTTGAGL
ncbi:MAG: glycosyltransferase [Kiritimatiellia bacterium]